MHKTIVLATGGFDPLHSGHIAYLKAARELGDYLIVGINSDQWLERKKGRAFMNVVDRRSIVESLSFVDQCITFDDSDNTAKEAIEFVSTANPDSNIIFVNGGDRTAENIPEQDLELDNVEFAFGIGGNEKKNSSSWLLQEWKEPKTERPWGYYRELYHIPGTKVKELTVEPGKSLSMQRHLSRSEFWFVAEGIGAVKHLESNAVTILRTHETYQIDRKQWHQLSNPGTEPVRIIEIQYGEQCAEDDIQRIDK